MDDQIFELSRSCQMNAYIPQYTYQAAQTKSLIYLDAFAEVNVGSYFLHVENETADVCYVRII